MLRRQKNLVVASLFVLGAGGFVLGLIPELAVVFWVLWFIGCGASILGLILAVVVPRAATPPGCRAEADRRSRSDARSAASDGPRSRPVARSAAIDAPWSHPRAETAHRTAAEPTGEIPLSPRG